MRLTPCAFLLFLVVVSGGHTATPPDFLWARRDGGSGDEEGRAVAVDQAGNIFVSGFFTNVSSFASTNVSSAGFEDAFLAKFDPAGNFLWLRQMGSIEYDEGLSVATDSAGNAYVAGLFQNTANFGPTSLTSSGQSDAFIAKYAPNGNLLWARKAGGADFDEARAIAVDNQGNVVITGYFDATATFGSLTLTNTTALDDIFIAKCDSSGNFLWARKAGGGSTNDVGNAIALDGNGNVYVTGYFGGTATFGNITLTASAGGLPDIFVAKYDAAGNFLWVRGGGGAGDDAGNAIVADGDGNVTVAGRFFGAAAFGNTNVTGNGRDIFVARYDFAGNLLWARKAGGNNVIYGDAGLGLARDSSSNVFVTGFYTSTANFGSTNVLGIAFNDVFCAKYDGAGNLLWVRAAGGTDLDLGYGIAVDMNGNVVLAGTFASATIAFGGTTLTNRGGRDAFLVKLGSSIIPTLGISRSSGQVVLSWPIAASDFTLESISNLSASAIWTALPSGSNTVGTNRVLALPTSESRKFFRLRK